MSGQNLERLKVMGLRRSITLLGGQHMNNHNDQSVYREKIVEHIFVSELLKYDWKYGGCEVDILKPEIDRLGHDIVVTKGDVVRKIQLKTSIVNSKVGLQKVHVDLLNSINGSIVWIVINSDLEMISFKVLIPLVGTCVGDFGFKISKHSKANSKGIKSKRPNIREIPKKKFTNITEFKDVFYLLFPNKKSAQQGDAPETGSSE